MNLDIKLLPWQQQVWNDQSRFKVVAAGRRTGKSRLAAWMLIVEALQADRGNVWYVAPTQGQARDIMWLTLLELGNPVIESSHVNNMQIKLVNGAVISLKGADRPETMRGVSLKFVVLDEYADMKPSVFEQILRPALADLKGKSLFIGTPMGRNHFYELYNYGDKNDDKEYKSWHFTSFDNPLLDPKEIEAAKKSMSSFAFRTEFMASFEAASGGIFKEEWIKIDEEEPKDGRYFVAVDLAGFENVAAATTAKKKRLDQSAIAIVKVTAEGWWVADIEFGRWDIKQTAQKIFDVVRDYEPVCVGIERGALKNAVLPYLSDLMRKYNSYFRIEDLTHGNKKKTDRITWSLQGRLEHGKITFNEGPWNSEIIDELMNFPNAQVHDDLIDALSYIDQIAIAEYTSDYEEDDYTPMDAVSGY
ncbi:large terminase protein [uncultured Caudovirales phage]|jgi:phage terminase large subunit-like protein|uniref:Large terminase protein n=1 Tax=uncultured Caudovirales phage TaxID=2100421 RepID=A0A6J5P4M3_9CAUD|nr:large terminase protein [uncultured Caudovirales phage]